MVVVVVVALTVDSTTKKPGESFLFTVTLTGAPANTTGIRIDFKYLAPDGVTWNTVASATVNADANGYASVSGAYPADGVGSYTVKATAWKGSDTMDSNTLTVEVVAEGGIPLEAEIAAASLAIADVTLFALALAQHAGLIKF